MAQPHRLTSPEAPPRRFTLRAYRFVISLRLWTRGQLLSIKLEDISGAVCVSHVEHNWVSNLVPLILCNDVCQTGNQIRLDPIYKQNKQNLNNFWKQLYAKHYFTDNCLAAARKCVCNKSEILTRFHRIQTRISRKSHTWVWISRYRWTLSGHFCLFSDQIWSKTNSKSILEQCIAIRFDLVGLFRCNVRKVNFYKLKLSHYKPLSSLHDRGYCLWPRWPRAWGSFLMTNIQYGHFIILSNYMLI